MSELPFVAKRALNVVTVLTSLWLTLLVVVMLTGGISNWPEFIGKNVLPALGAYAAAGVASYIFFGKFTLWHKAVGGRKSGGAA